MLTCTKRYTDIPFAHRAPSHDGHCAYVHGHSWGLEVEFGAATVDENGFVVDFGKLAKLKGFLDEHFDHALVIAADDPELTFFHRMHDRGLCKLMTVPGTSSEDLARYFAGVFDALVNYATGGRGWVKRVTVFEDSRNSATYRAPPRPSEKGQHE